MARTRSKWWGSISCFLVMVLLLVLAESSLANEAKSHKEAEEVEAGFVMKAVSSLHPKSKEGYQHKWPKIEFSWRIIVGSIIGFFGAACGSVGGVGGGGIFVPMLALIIGFDPKSSTAMSKCMITGAAAATVYYNLKLRHPTLDLPIIDYDLALLFQPVLVLGISIGVTLNVLFAEWMITILLIILFLFMSTKAFFKGMETWKKETIKKRVEKVTRPWPQHRQSPSPSMQNDHHGGLSPLLSSSHILFFFLSYLLAFFLFPTQNQIEPLSCKLFFFFSCLLSLSLKHRHMQSQD